MSSAPKVGATAGPSPAADVGGWGHSGHTSRSSAGQAAGAQGAGSFGVHAGWRPQQDDRHGQGYFFFGKYPEKDDPKPALFTPIMALFASAFAATEPVMDKSSGPQVFISDLMRGLGVYDFNMKAIAGTLRPQGAVINRYG